MRTLLFFVIFRSSVMKGDEHMSNLRKEWSEEEIMETKYKFHTLVKKDHKFGNNDHMLGRLIGYQQLLCDGFREENHRPQHVIDKIEEGTVLTCECTPDEYAEFTKLVKRHFPEDLCVFDWRKEN